MNQTWMKKAVSCSAVLLVALLSSACGGGGGSSATSSDPSGVASGPGGTGSAGGSGSTGTGTGGGMTPPGRTPTELLLPGPPAVGSNTYTCANVRVGAVQLDTVYVPPGATCALVGTRTLGTVQVDRGAYLDAIDVQVGGSLQSQQAQDISVTGSSRVAGSIQLERTAGGMLRGVAVTGDIQLVDNLGPLIVEANAVGGNLQANRNTGGLRIESNRMTGNLECQANQPPPAGGGNTAALKTGQCSVL